MAEYANVNNTSLLVIMKMNRYSSLLKLFGYFLITYHTKLLISQSRFILFSEEVFGNKSAFAQVISPFLSASSPLCAEILSLKERKVSLDVL